MDIAFRGRRQVVVHHVRHRRNIQPPRRHIGRHEEFGLPGSKRIHHTVALGLIHPAMNRFGSMPAVCQHGRQLVDFNTRAAEHERRLRSFHVQNTSQSHHFMLSGHNVGCLMHPRRNARLERLFGNLDFDRILQMAFGNGRDAGRHGRGEERCLSLFGCLFKNGVQILGKSHVEHLIGLV